MDKQVSRQFFNEKAAHWDEMERSNAPHQLEAMIERLTLKAGGRVLDVGTGTGVFIPYIKRSVGTAGQVVCVDFALEMLLVARQKYPDNGMLPVCAEIETVGFLPGSFDAIVCYSTFPHFHDKPLALENMFTLLKEGGHVYICHTASREAINAIHSSIPDFSDHLIPPKEEMEMMMEVTGFKDIVVDERADSYLAFGLKKE